MPLVDDIRRAFRDFVSWGESNPLPIGDPRSGVHNPSKAEIRDVLVAMLQAAGNPDALQAILTELNTKADATAVQRPNMVADAYMRELRWNLRISGGIRPAILGTLTAPDASSPVAEGASVSNTGSGQARRTIALPDGMRSGDLATFLFVFSATGNTQATITFRNSAFAALTSHNADGVATGTMIERPVTAEVPEGAAFVEFGLSSTGTATKILYGTLAALGTLSPSRADIWRPTPAQINKYPDHLFKAAAAGVRLIDGFPLLGANVTATLEPPPAESPFGTRCLRLPPGAAAHDLRIDAGRLGLVAGRDLHLTVGYVYAGTVTATIQLLNAAGAVIGSSLVTTVDCRHPTTAARTYAEMRVRIPIDATAVATAASLRIRAFSAGASLAECFIIGVSVADAMHYLTDPQTAVDISQNIARAAVPSRTLGARVAIFGDSIPANTINVDGGLNWYLHDYMQTVVSAEILNFAVGGTTMAGRDSVAYDAFSMSALADAIHSNTWGVQDANIGAMNSPANIRYPTLKALDWSTLAAVLLMFGTNDYGAEQRAIGGNDDTTRATFKGGLNNVFSKLLDHAPHLRLMVCTPIWRERMVNSFAGSISISGITLTVNTASTASLAVGDTVLARGIDRRITITALGTGSGGVGTYTIDRAMTLAATQGYSWNPATNGRDLVNSVGHTLDDYAQAIREIAALHGVHVIDLAREIGWGQSNMAWWMNDGVHPNGWNGLPLLGSYLARRAALAI